MEGLRRTSYDSPYQAYLREHPPPTLVAWEPRTGTCREGGAGPLRGSAFDESEQVGVELLLPSLGDAVRAARVDLQRRVFDDFRRQ